MSIVPRCEAELVEQASKFAASIEPQRARWEYCLRASHYKFRTRRGPVVLAPNAGSMETAAKILGKRKFWAVRGFREINRVGYDAALEEHGAFRARLGLDLVQDAFAVGPVKAWSMGHVYFARVADHPHVLKIGFSRRVHERLDDIESKHGVRLVVRPGELKVATLLDEQWWHRNWRTHNISGEWFFDPFVNDRTLPAFLQSMAEAA